MGEHSYDPARKRSAWSSLMRCQAASGFDLRPALSVPMFVPVSGRLEHQKKRVLECASLLTCEMPDVLAQCAGVDGADHLPLWT
jgi:hypothetical protein